MADDCPQSASSSSSSPPPLPSSSPSPAQASASSSSASASLSLSRADRLQHSIDVQSPQQPTTRHSIIGSWFGRSSDTYRTTSGVATCSNNMKSSKLFFCKLFLLFLRSPAPTLVISYMFRCLAFFALRLFVQFAVVRVAGP